MNKYYKYITWLTELTQDSQKCIEKEAPAAQLRSEQIYLKNYLGLLGGSSLFYKLLLKLLAALKKTEFQNEK
jgi:hypothetical protein